MIRALLSCGLPSILPRASAAGTGRKIQHARRVAVAQDARGIDGTAQGAELRKPRIEARDILVLEREMLAPVQARIDEPKQRAGEPAAELVSRTGVASAGHR